MAQSNSTLFWQGGIDGSLILLDQAKLPRAIEYVESADVDQVWMAIRDLQVRGAPAIGIAAAYGVCLGIQGTLDASLEQMRARVALVVDYLATSRPTAVNLFWALERMQSVAKQAKAASARELAARLLHEANAIHEEDARMCTAIGRHGAELLAELPEGGGILTHCNAGALATGGEGTALAVIYELARRGTQPRVWVDETRPLLQGSRLTTWELMQNGIHCTLICDNMAAHVMQTGQVQAVITGADRIAANGDAANKIGTYGLAVLARAHEIPFYIAAPTSTIDMSLSTGADIPIEQRSGSEIVQGSGRATAPEGVQVYNPAFDVTPAELLTAVVTDRGVLKEPNQQRMAEFLGAKHG